RGFLPGAPRATTQRAGLARVHGVKRARSVDRGGPAHAQPTGQRPPAPAAPEPRECCRSVASRPGALGYDLVDARAPRRIDSLRRELGLQVALELDQIVG